jgi:hypothetical protein
MKIKCPFCNGNFNLEDYVKDTIMVQVIKMMPDFGAHGRLVWEYAEMFGISPPLNARKLHRILSEVLEFFRGGGFVFQQKKYEISRDGLAAGIRTVCNAAIKGPLTNHNYLKKICIGIAEEEAKRRGKDEEGRRRKAESNIQAGDRVERIADVPGKVRDLLGKIG